MESKEFLSSDDVARWRCMLEYALHDDSSEKALSQYVSVTDGVALSLATILLTTLPALDMLAAFMDAPGPGQPS